MEIIPNNCVAQQEYDETTEFKTENLFNYNKVIIIAKKFIVMLSIAILSMPYTSNNLLFGPYIQSLKK